MKILIILLSVASLLAFLVAGLVAALPKPAAAHALSPDEQLFTDLPG